MSRRVLQPIFFAALLSLGASSGAAAAIRATSHDTNGADPAQSLTEPGIGISASLPSHGLVTWLLAGADTDSRSGRPAPARNPGRARLNLLRPSVSRCHTTAYNDAGTRLARGGLHNSSLGTPPPQS